MNPIKMATFVHEDGTSEIERWYSGQSKADKAIFDDRVNVLEYFENWKMPLARSLADGECSGLREIRFRIQNVQQRPIGCFGLVPHTFVVLYWATEKGGKFVPKDACQRAQVRRNQAKEKTSLVME